MFNTSLLLFDHIIILALPLVVEMFDVETKKITMRTYLYVRMAFSHTVIELNNNNLKCYVLTFFFYYKILPFSKNKSDI